MIFFEEYANEIFDYNIEGAEINSTTGVMTVKVKSNCVFPFDVVKKCRDMLTDELADVTDAVFEFTYTTIEQEKHEAIFAYVPYLLSRYEKDSAGLLNSVIKDDVDISDDTLTIRVLGETASEKLNEKIAGKIAGDYERDLGYSLSVRFRHDEEQYKEHEQKAEDKENSYVPLRNKSPESSSDHSHFDGSLFLGKPIRDDAKPISESEEGERGVILEGEVFSVDSRTGKTKFGKDYALITFAIYDGTGTMACKAFFDGDRWKAVKDDFINGVYVKTRGNIAYDEYARRITLDVKSMQIGEKEERKDDMPEKRVELHAHTKMSDMDALSDPGELVRLAASWGHKAVAVTDHGVVQAFPDVMNAAQGEDIKIIYGMEGYVYDDKEGTVGHKDARTNHIILLAKSQQGIRNLYRLVSESHIEYFYYRPRIPKSLIKKYREGLIVGSACVAGEVFSAVVRGASDEELEKIADFYDYLEIMPLVNNRFMIREPKYENVKDDQDLINMNMRIVHLGEKMGRPVCATCDAHYLNEEDAIYRKVLKAGQHYDDADEGDGLFLRTTAEMLAEFSYLGEEKAKEVVIRNTSMIADLIDENITPIAKGNFPPKIENSEETLKRTCEKNASEKYGSPLPDVIRQRLDKELDSIIGNGYAVMYMSAKMLVEQSMSDGYVVGSRGSVGSSFAATMSGITEVNPLPAHYICPHCKHLEWGDPSAFECGIDMPPKECPQCGHMMDRDGHSIPFETFLGFEGNKEPDIDLNFAGDYQATAHKYVEEMFGSENVFKAGTISTVKYLTAKAFTEKYYEDHGQVVDKYEVDRIANHCVGVKRTTGQHPGGIIIVPAGHEITEFCPVQRPANDSGSDITTTHFHYHSIEKNLLKLDILGHDAPSIIRHLFDLTGIDPMTTPMDDPDVNALFLGTESLNIKYDDYKFKHGSYGIPEFGTSYVRQMLDDTKPTRFADLVRISGLSHGTNVWTGNAQEFIRNGQTTIEGAICTRDDIMNYLINQGLPSSDAFNIMEAVRKGKGVKQEQEDQMRAAGVEPWYIESCNLISYMFPRAHAVAYVMMSYRIAYFKVHYPEAFYAAFLTTKISGFKWDVISRGRDAIIRQLDVIYHMDRSEQKKKEVEMTVYEIAYEMLSRGYSFEPPTLATSPALKFTVRDGKVVVPLCALEGVGESVGKILDEEKSIRPFSTIEDLQERGKVNKAAIDTLRKFGVLDGMPESDQLSLF